MKKTNFNLLLCCGMFITALVISNAVANKLIDVPIRLCDQNIWLPGSAICFIFTFLILNVITEIWGKDRANQCVKIGVVCQIFAALLIILTQYLPPVDTQIQESYDYMLGRNWIFVVAGLLAYVCSKSLNVAVFGIIKNQLLSSEKFSEKHRGLWNFVSTAISQAVDTTVFIVVACGLGCGWLFDTSLQFTLILMIIGQYMLKVIAAIITTPIFYICTRKVSRFEETT